MAKVICIMGESGSGKTTSCRNLDPTTTYYIDADRKGLSWKGWKKQYNAENKNYLCVDDPNLISNYISAVADKCPKIKTIVVDTINAMMISDEIRRMGEKGYDKWIDLATCIWKLVDMAYPLRDDLTIIFIAHTQTERDDSGYMFTRIKTSGKKLDKIGIECKFTTVLLAKCIKKAELIAYEDLGAEALRRLEVEDMPLFVIIDSEGNNLYEMGREEYLKAHKE